MTVHLRRLQNFLNGKTSAVLDRPEQRLAVYISDANKQIRKMERGVTRATSYTKRLQQQIEALRARSTQCETRILTALERGNETRARSALEKREAYDAKVAALESAWKAHHETTSQLVASLELSKSRREEAQRKRDLLVAEHKWAETRKKIRAQALKVAAPALIAQIEDKIRSAEAEAEVQLVLNAESVDAEIEAGLQALDARRSGEAALAQLKSRVAAHPDEATERIENLKRTLAS